MSTSPNEKRVNGQGTQSADAKENGSDTSSTSTISVEDEQRLPPVAFYKLFQYSTKLDLFLDFIGIIAALAAGAAQPMMTLLFGKLTNGFVGFGIAVMNAMRPGAGPAEQQALQQAADAFRHDASVDALYLVIIGIGMMFTTYVWMLIWTWTGETNAKRIREHYLKAILRQDIAYFDSVGPGEVATRIQSDTHLVHLGIAEKVALIAVCLGAFVAGFILAYIQSWKLALAMTSIFPCIALCGAVMTRLISRIKTSQLDHIAAGGTLAEEGLSTIRTAKAFGAQNALSDLYNVHVNRAHLLELKLSVIMGIGMSAVFFVVYSSYGLAFSFGTTLILSGEANAGKVVNVVFAILIASFSMAQLPSLLEALANARGAASKLFATIERIPPIDSANPGGLKPEKVEGVVTLENVKFNYPARPDVPIFKGLSISFAAGKTSALVGASGSGKSTIVSLIERFYDPLSGSVGLDGNNLRDLNLKWLRSQIGLVSQEPILFATTIRGNVEHGFIGHKLAHATPEERFAAVKEACIKANADGFISNLPLGYDTMVGERGFLLSGGQKQRIAIARAIASDPRILLLDEATSALDTQSEGVVQNALDKASRGRTTITIAHRLSTIKDADVIFVMGEGEVLESGTHQELLRDPNGPYAKLVQAQKLRDAERRDVTGTVGEEADDDQSPLAAQKEMRALEEAAADEVPLGRTHTERSLASEILAQRDKTQGENAERQYTLYESFRRMAILNRHSQQYYYIGTIAAMATGMVYPCYGILFAKGISGFQLSGHELRVTGDRNALWFFILAVCATISISTQNYTFLRASAGLSEVLRKISFKSMLRQDVAFFDERKNSTGALTMKLSDNPEKIRGLAGITLGSIVQALFTIVGGSIIGLAYGWKLSLIGMACIPFVIGTGYIRLHVIRLKDVTNKRLHEDSAQLACEAAGAIRTVASLTREDDCYEEYSRSLDIPLQKSNRSSVWSTSAFAISQAMSFFVIALIFWEGSRLVASLEYDTFTFFVCMMSVTFGGIQAGNIFSFAPDISEAGRASDDILGLLDNEIEIDSEATEGEHVPKVVGKIELRDVHFRYPTRPAVRVLRGFNLTVEPGTHVALVGQSGCGKSTIIQLVERFYDPLHGTVNVDGRDISKLNVQEYRKYVALVSQEPTLYSGTIKFNILLGATKPVDQVTQEELEEACRNANILDFINSLPQGFETEVGGKGSQLSGGQKQRVAIARALLRNPSILLLDEATSALDSNSERVVQQALDVAAKGRTTISIAHRLSTIQGCDKIHFVFEGQIVESGTHDELMKLGGHYAEFVALQDLSHQ